MGEVPGYNPDDDKKTRVIPETDQLADTELSSKIEPINNKDGENSDEDSDFEKVWAETQKKEQEIFADYMPKAWELADEEHGSYIDEKIFLPLEHTDKIIWYVKKTLDDKDFDKDHATYQLRVARSNCNNAMENLPMLNLGNGDKIDPKVQKLLDQITEEITEIDDLLIKIE